MWYDEKFISSFSLLESLKLVCFFLQGSLFVPDSLIKSLDLHKDVYIAPNGVAFVKPHIRQGYKLNKFKNNKKGLLNLKLY